MNAIPTREDSILATAALPVTDAAVEPSSFRDPGGFVFERDGTLYRQVNPRALEGYTKLRQSGLYDVLTGDGLLIAHTEVSLQERMTDEAQVILQPEHIPFLTYCYEWCFGQIRDAALVTLTIQREALQRGLSLKDASAYNIQFRSGCRPVLIDTLSFEPYAEGAPWVAYRQFCQHFLAPLALMSHTDIRLAQLLQPNLDGIPLDLAAHLLPARDRFHASLLPHIFLHSAAQRRHAADNARSDTPPAAAGMAKNALLGLIDSLESGIRSLNWRPAGTVWGSYYEGGTNYAADAFEAKRTLTAALLEDIQPRPAFALDFGANTGVFSRLAAERGIETIALDTDPAAVEQCYQECRGSSRERLLPMVQDLMNPSPSLGWAQSERKSLLERCATAERRGGSVAFALALVHHPASPLWAPIRRASDRRMGAQRGLAGAASAGDARRYLRRLHARRVRTRLLQQPV